MKFYKQLHLHDPENRVFGDCDRTSIACLLNKHPSEVPHWGRHFDDAPTYNKIKREYLESQGLILVQVVYSGETPLVDVLKSVGGSNPGVYYLLTGTSRTGVNHVVICRDGEIAHDPSIDDSGIVGPADSGYFHVEFLAPLFTSM